MRIATFKDVLVRNLGQETVALSLGSGQYYVMNEVASRAWEALSSGRSVDDVARSLVGEFDVDVEALRQDLVEFISDLLDHGLAELVETESIDA